MREPTRSWTYGRSLARKVVLQAERYAPVDHQLMAGRIPRLVRGEKGDGLRDVFRRAERAHRNASPARGAHVFVRVDAGTHAGVDEARRHRIDANAIRPE